MTIDELRKDLRDSGHYGLDEFIYLIDTFACEEDKNLTQEAIDYKYALSEVVYQQLSKITGINTDRIKEVVTKEVANESK